MNVRLLPGRITYDGSQLRPHWILRTTALVGDALVAFRGPCALPRHEIADLEDHLAGAEIAGDDMLHFIAERFDDGDLDRATLRQRLLAACALDVLGRLAPKQRMRLRRTGDDLYCGDGKLSVSIATRSAVSSLLHFGINISNRGTPVRTRCLRDLGVPPARFARALLAAWAAEEDGIAHARCKVRVRGEA